MTQQYVLFSGVNIKGILLIAVATVQLASSAVDAQGSGTRWPTTEFKVFHREPTIPEYSKEIPFDKIRDWVREMLSERIISSERRAQIRSADLAWERLVEGYLHDIASRYQEAGFEPPELKVVEDEGKKKYVVYLVDFGERIKHRNAFGLARGLPTLVHQIRDQISWSDTILIARQKFSFEKENVESERNEVFLYSVLAHELFHALQFSYDRKFGSIGLGREGVPGGDVMVEGVADGAAMYLVSKKFPGYLERKESQRGQLGGFEYYTMFLDATKEGSPTSAYHTGSFWFHLAERFGSLSVIEYLLRQRPSGLSMADRIRWLDEGLKDHPGIKEGLYTIFPHFVTQLLSYGSGRYQRVKPDDWLIWTLGRCKSIEFNPETEVNAKHVFEFFGPIESRCVEASWSGFPPDGQLKVEVIGPNRDVLEQLHLGIAAGEGNCWKFLNSLDPGKRRKQTCLLERLNIQTGPSEGMWAKTWEIAPGGYGASGRAVFVVSNVAVDPSDSWSRDNVRQSALADGTIIRFGFTRTETQEKKLAPPEAEHIRLPPHGNLRELTYGLRKTKPMPSSPPIPEIKIPILEISGREPDLLESSLKGNLNRRKGTREYRVLPNFTKPIVPGYTGPLYGNVTLHDPNLPMSGGGIMSGFCDPTGKLPIGQVLRAEEDQMKVHVKADLCEVKMTLTPPFPKPPYPVVDHLDAVIVLPFGWRYFRDKAPVDFVTAGVQIFMDRYHERMEAHWGSQWQFISAPTGPTGPGTSSGPGSGSGAGPGAGTGSGKGSTLGGPGCDCSCESFNQLKGLSKRRDAASQKKLKQLSLCAMQCMSQWTVCAQSGTSP